VLAGDPSGPKAAAATGHIRPASRAQRAPDSAVDYVFIMVHMDASERALWQVLSADGGARFLGGPFLDPKSADLVLFLAEFKIIFKSI
jgi:hypothetical protein